MKSQLSGFFILSGLLAGIAAAIIAYFITYNNFFRHYSKSRLPGKIAAVTAIVVFVGFFGSMMIVGYFLLKYFHR